MTHDLPGTDDARVVRMPQMPLGPKASLRRITNCAVATAGPRLDGCVLGEHVGSQGGALAKKRVCSLGNLESCLGRAWHAELRCELAALSLKAEHAELSAPRVLAARFRLVQSLIPRHRQQLARLGQSALRGQALGQVDLTTRHCETVLAIRVGNPLQVRT